MREGMRLVVRSAATDALPTRPTASGEHDKPKVTHRTLSYTLEGNCNADRFFVGMHEISA